MTVREAAFKGFMEAGMSEEEANRLLDIGQEAVPEFTASEVPAVVEEWCVNHAKKKALLALSIGKNNKNN